MKKLIAVVALSGAMAGCQALDTYLEDRLDQQSKAYYESYMASAEIQQRKIEDIETEFREAVENLQDAIAAGNTSGASVLLDRMAALQKMHQQAVHVYDQVVDKADGILKDGVRVQAQGVLGLLDPLVPIPLQPLVPLASSLAVMALSKRSRTHALKGVKSLAKGNIGELIGFVLKAIGASHSSQVTQQVATLEAEGKSVKVTDSTTEP